LHVSSEKQTIGCIGFGMGHLAAKFAEGSLVDVICEPQFNEWNGQRSIQLRLVDMDLHEPC